MSRPVYTPVTPPSSHPDTTNRLHHRCFGVTELPAEETSHPALRIVPGVHTVPTPLRSGVFHQVRYTGDWTLIHLHTGNTVPAGQPMPLPWLRRFARLLATSIDWNRVTGDTGRAGHPDHHRVRAIAAHVLDCWIRGVPVSSQLFASLSVDTDHQYSLSCANPDCDDEAAVDGCLTVLTGSGADGEDETWVAEHDLPELYVLAHDCGWTRITGESERWLCHTCAASHQPAPGHLAARLRALRPAHPGPAPESPAGPRPYTALTEAPR